ncbi:MAG: SIS domain-containing protein, partial [Neisseriaceae bacterium]
MQITEEQIEKFWKAHKRFLKTTLTTEKPHPKTHNLSNLCQTNLSQAIQIFHEVELNAIKYASNYVQDIFILKQSIEKCLNQNGNIYLVGCGASARLAVLLRRLWEISNPSKTGRVISICAAGDISLIKSIEQFEDSKDYGIKQLEQQSFTNNDLLIGLTASGESPFILACIEHAKNSIHTPWLVCNNSIKDIFERNPKHIAKEEHLNILSLNVGEMALTGSTRLQATTAMQLAVGLALIGPCNTTIDINRQISYIYDILYSINLAKLDKLIELESNIVTLIVYIIYPTDYILLGVSVLSDVTVRSPSFIIELF